MVNQSEKIALAEQRGIRFHRDKNNDILIERVSLDEIHTNTFKVKPKVNCRNIHKGRLGDIKNTLKNKGMGFDVTWGVFDSNTRKYCIVDGNHLQTAARELGETHIRMLMFNVDVSNPEEAWALYCFSYDINRKSILIAEKINAVWHGFLYHKRRKERYQDYLPIEFGEPEQTIERIKTLYTKLRKLRKINKKAAIELVNSSKIHDWSETKFREQLNECLEKKLKESEESFDDGEETTRIDGLVFQKISYMKNIGRRVKTVMEGNTNISDIDEDLSKISATIIALKEAQEEGDFPSIATKNKLNTAFGAFKSRINDYKKELKNKEKSVESCLKTYNEVKEYKNEMKCR